MATNHSAKLAVVRFQLEFGGQYWVFHAKADADKLERACKRVIKIVRSLKNMI